MSQQRLTDLLRLAIGKTDIGQRPETLDQVMVGMADRIRPGEPRATFVIGAVEGISGGGQCRRCVHRPGANPPSGGGVELAQNIEEKSVYEKFYAYFAVTTPRERLYISYPKEDGKGGALAPSVIPLSGGENPGVSPEPRCRRPHQGGGQPSVSEGGVLLGSTTRTSPQRASLQAFLEERDGELLDRMGSGPKPGWICHPEPGFSPGSCSASGCVSPPPGWSSTSPAPLGISAPAAFASGPRRKVEFSPWSLAR